MIQSSVNSKYYGIYPGSTPEFRIVKKSDGSFEQQVRYVHFGNGYTGKWMPVEIVEEDTK